MENNNKIFLAIIEEMQQKLQDMSRHADNTIEFFANNSISEHEVESSRQLISKLMDISLDFLHLDKKLESIRNN